MKLEREGGTKSHPVGHATEFGLYAADEKPLAHFRSISTAERGRIDRRPEAGRPVRDQHCPLLR